VPIIASLRWHVTNVGWKWIFRGNTDFTFSGSITAIPRGPETHYYAFNFGIRRNFVYRNWKVVPYWEQRGGAGIIDAKEPLGVLFAQGQNLTFTHTVITVSRVGVASVTRELRKDQYGSLCDCHHSVTYSVWRM
jgi:hypothetical protein